MIDLNLFIKAIKAGWVKRITNDDNDGDWKHIYMNILKTVGECLVFESNLNERDFYKEQRNFNSTFLFEIVQAWSHINFNINPKIIKNQIIWNNSFIKNNNKTLFYKYWFGKCIKYIEQLFDIRHKTFYTFQHIKNVYILGNSEFFKYYTLIQSIPDSWKQMIKVETLLHVNEHTFYCNDFVARNLAINFHIISY